MQPPIRILLADDHNVLREGMRLLLERQPGFEVVGEASDGRETIGLVEDQHPDVVIMDIAMPNLNGIEATRRITERSPRVGVVILSMHHDESYVIRSLKAGARAYLLRTPSRRNWSPLFRRWRRDDPFSVPRSADLQEDYSALGRKGGDDSFDLLTGREHEILQLIAEGKTNKEVANLLHLSLIPWKRTDQHLKS